MKTLKTIIAGSVLSLLVVFNLAAQMQTKVVAVVNKADWCGVCKKNGERAMGTFNAVNQDGSVLFIVNDLTTDETIKKSKEVLKKHGLDEAIAKLDRTGMVYFFNADSKALISMVSVAEKDPLLADAFSSAKKVL